MDKTYVKVAGRWKCLVRAVDCTGDTVFMLQAKRNQAAVHAFFKRAIGLHEIPEKIATGKSGDNTGDVASIQVDSSLIIALH